MQQNDQDRRKFEELLIFWAGVCGISRLISNKICLRVDAYVDGTLNSLSFGR